MRRIVGRRRAPGTAAAAGPRRRARPASGELARLSLPSASRTPAASERRHVGRAHAEARVAARAEHDVHAALGEQLAVGGVHLDSVRRDEPRVQHAEALAVARPGSGAGASKLTCPRPREARKPGQAPLPSARKSASSGDSARWIAAGPPRATRRRSSSGETECGAWAASRSSRPGRSAAASLATQRLAPGERRLGPRRIPGQQLQEDDGRQARRGQPVEVRERVRDVADRHRARGLERADRRRGRRARSRRPSAGRGSRRPPRPTARSRPPSSGSRPARCDSSRWQCALTRPGSRTPSPRSWTGPSGCAGIAGDDRPRRCDRRETATTTVADRRTRDRKQPGGPE